MTSPLHPTAPAHLPQFITAPGETDVGGRPTARPLIDLPDFGNPLRKLAGSVEKAWQASRPGGGAGLAPDEVGEGASSPKGALELPKTIAISRPLTERIHA